MIPQGVRGDKKGWHQVQATKVKFRELLTQFKSNNEIMTELGLKKTTFYRYKSIIMEEDRVLWMRMKKWRDSIKSMKTKVKLFFIEQNCDISVKTRNCDFSCAQFMRLCDTKFHTT